MTMTIKCLKCIFIKTVIVTLNATIFQVISDDITVNKPNIIRPCWIHIVTISQKITDIGRYRSIAICIAQFWLAVIPKKSCSLVSSGCSPVLTLFEGWG